MKPLITYFILSYNQENYIQDAVLSAFSQDYSPLQIIISDDCSSDNSSSIIRQLATSYNGPHKIILNFNKNNLGIGRHINRIMEMANGELIVAAAGDDISLPERVTEIYRVYESSNGLAKSIFSNSIIIDKKGIPVQFVYDKPRNNDEFKPTYLVKHNSILTGCSHAWSKDVFSIFGPLITPLTCEDIVIPLRSSLLGQIKYIHKPLVLYRRHATTCWNYKWNEKSKYIATQEIKFEKFWINDRFAIYNNWNKDLQKMMSISPSREEELLHLQKIVLERLSDVQEQKIMLENNFFDNLKIITKKISSHHYDYNSIKHEVGFFLFPKLYELYLTAKYLLKNKNSKSN